ncbi:PREDICTED: MYB mRNAion factor [Prunus dulcis]|uniref:PREDICTED: MYB mRNAion factor n=2 Tax=Prunus TaxID=3754 RepID=A0A5E4FGS2_PRUDU|nr:uncharacterized protein LOC117619143 [Prunus dulcis]VVA27353.1 PREDICTED: MYB mRNAion factor [Prunus dulcis]
MNIFFYKKHTHTHQNSLKTQQSIYFLKSPLGNYLNPILVLNLSLKKILLGFLSLCSLSRFFSVFSQISLANIPTAAKEKQAMDKRRRKQAKTSTCCSEEVSSIEWEFINMSEQEEDLICRMYKLVGDRWGLIAGRIPGRKAEEIERFWLMRHGEVFASRRRTELKSNNKRYNS